MQLDGYSPCPCGCGEKLKFCCCKDLLRDLEKVLRGLTGEQYAATEVQLTQLIAERGPRAALLALLSNAQLAQQKLPAARQSAEKLLETVHNSSVAHVVLAICDAMEGRTEDAVEHAQQFLEMSGLEATPDAATAISLVGQALLNDGHILAARGHYMFLAKSLSSQSNKQLIEALQRLDLTPGMPVPLKQDFVLSQCPAGVPWAGEFAAAMKSAARGAWLAACESLQSLDEKVPHQAAILRNIAILRTWLAHEDAVAAWRRYELLPDVSEQDAVDAEAVCQLLGLPTERESSDVLRLDFAIKDMDRLMEVLLSAKRCAAVDGDFRTSEDDEQPPPKAVFQLLDRPAPAATDGLTREDLPQVLGVLLLFGKQTDRDARLECGVRRATALNEAQAALKEIAGDCLGPETHREVVNQIPLVDLAMQPEYWFPPDLPAERHVELQLSIRDWAFNSVWPDLPQELFEGKTARAAAQDPRLRIRVAGAILNFELAAEDIPRKIAFDFDGLRQQLGLSLRGTFQVTDPEIVQVPLARWSRMDFSALTEVELQNVFYLVLHKNLRRATCLAAKALIAKRSANGEVELTQLHRAIAMMSPETDEALEHIEAGRQVFESQGKSPAPWHLMELQVRLARYEADEANRLAKLLATKYRDEPGIADGLYQVLNRAGVLPPSGRRAQQQPVADSPIADPVAEPSGASPALWTPDSASSNKESKLWLPGMQ